MKDLKIAIADPNESVKISIFYLLSKKKEVSK
jgi:hypothetical protein